MTAMNKDVVCFSSCTDMRTTKVVCL